MHSAALFPVHPVVEAHCPACPEGLRFKSLGHRGLCFALLFFAQLLPSDLHSARDTSLGPSDFPTSPDWELLRAPFIVHCSITNIQFPHIRAVLCLVWCYLAISFPSDTSDSSCLPVTVLSWLPKILLSVCPSGRLIIAYLFPHTLLQETI